MSDNLIQSPVGTVSFDSTCQRSLNVQLGFYMLSGEFKTRGSTVLVYKAVLFYGNQKIETDKAN